MKHKNYLAIYQKNCDLAARFSLVAIGFAIPISVSLTSIFTIATLILWLISGNWVQKLHTIKNNHVAIVAIILFGLFLLGTLYDFNSMSIALKGLHKYSKLLLIPIFIPLITSKKWQKAGINSFLLAMLVTLIISYLRLFHITDLHFYKPSTCPATVFRSHIETGFFMAFAAFIFLCYTFTQQKYKWLYGLLFLLSSYNIFFMNSGKTGYAIYIALLILFLWQKFSWKGILLSIIVIPILGYSAYLASPMFKTSTKTAIQNVDRYTHKKSKFGSIGDRLLFAKNSIILIKQRPIFGHGTGSFKATYKSNFPPVPGFPKGLVTPHNEYLLITVQLGAIGLLLFLVLLFTQWKYSLKLPDDTKLIAQGLIVAFMVGACCNSMLYTTATGHFYVYFSAILWALTRDTSESTKE